MLIYDELVKTKGKLSRFSEYLVEKGLYKNPKTASNHIRDSKVEDIQITKLYEEWKDRHRKEVIIKTHNDKLADVFNSLRKTPKKELLDKLELFEEVLMDLTLIIKKKEYDKLPELKTTLEGVIYGPRG